MSKNISDQDAENIKSILDGWPIDEKLSWEALVKTIATTSKNGKSWTRVALCKHSDIYDAYKLKKYAQKAYRGAPPPVETDEGISPELRTALKTMARMESEIARLKLENQRWKELYVTITANAHSHNLTEEMLHKPLITVDRGSSKKEDT